MLQENKIVFISFFRTRDEIQEVRQNRDPITGFREKLVATGLADSDELKAIEVKTEIEIRTVKLGYNDHGYNELKCVFHFFKNTIVILLQNIQNY